MKIHEATEQAYKNGYEKGKQDAVKHGKWHDIYQVSSWCSTGHCSVCEEVAVLPIRGLGTPYCPNCGAKMDGDGQ